MKAEDTQALMAYWGSVALELDSALLSWGGAIEFYPTRELTSKGYLSFLPCLPSLYPARYFMSLKASTCFCSLSASSSAWLSASSLSKIAYTCFCSLSASSSACLSASSLSKIADYSASQGQSSHGKKISPAPALPSSSQPAGWRLQRLGNNLKLEILLL